MSPPLEGSSNRISLANDPPAGDDLADVRTSVNFDRPLGGPIRTRRVAERLDLSFTPDA